jgi:uncharacterized repeat protein (TIGR01451 family)
MTRRNLGTRVAGLLCGLSLLPSGFAAAQTVGRPHVVFDDAQIFHPATDPSRFVTVYDSRSLDPGQYAFGLYGTYAENPIVLDFESGGRSSHLVKNTIGADLIASFGITDRLQLGIDIPGVWNHSEKVVNFGGDTEPGGAFIGDIGLEAKFSIIPRPIGHGFGLSLLPRIVVPSGDNERFAGSGKIGGGGLLIADWRYNKINYGVNVGGIFRNSDEVDDHLQAGAGITVPATRFLDVIGEVTGRTGLRGERNSPVEGLLSFRFHNRRIAFTIGGGGGITSGRGAPEYRVIAGITPYIAEKEIPPPQADLITNSRKTWNLAADIDNDGRPNPGDTIEYSINVVNTGTAEAQEVEFVDAIPEHASYVPGSMTLNGTAVTDGADADAADFDTTNRGAVTVKIGSVPFEEGKNSATFTFRVTIDPNVVDITVVRNEAIVTQRNVIPPEEAEGEFTPRIEQRLPIAETTVFPRVRERETVVVTPDKLELTRNIHFEFNKATIRSESFPILTDVAEVLKDNPKLNILIEGHTDAVGGVDYNQKLSDRRAQSVKAYLVSKGVAAGRLTTKGRGKLAPIASNDTAVGRALNRRVEFLIVNPEVVRGTVEKRSYVEDITPQSEPSNLEDRGSGSRGGAVDRDVIEAQEALRKIDYLSEAPSGIVTPGTKAALERFQRENGLPVTGAADAITRKALDEAIELHRSR